MPKVSFPTRLPCFFSSVRQSINDVGEKNESTVSAKGGFRFLLLRVSCSACVAMSMLDAGLSFSMNCAGLESQASDAAPSGPGALSPDTEHARQDDCGNPVAKTLAIDAEGQGGAGSTPSRGSSNLRGGGDGNSSWSPLTSQTVPEVLSPMARPADPADDGSAMADSSLGARARLHGACHPVPVKPCVTSHAAPSLGH